MNKVKKTQAKIRTFLQDFYKLFSNLKEERDFVERFRKSFPTPEAYWRHIFRHAVPKKVLEELGISNWKQTMAHSKQLFPYQKEYARIALDALTSPSKLALIEEKYNPVGKIIIMNERKNVVLLLETTGAFASAYRMDKFESWEEWKMTEIFRGSRITEVPIDEEVRKVAGRIRENCKRYL